MFTAELLSALGELFFARVSAPLLDDLLTILSFDFYASRSSVCVSLGRFCFVSFYFGRHFGRFIYRVVPFRARASVSAA